MPLQHIGVFYNEFKTHVEPLAAQAVDFLRSKQVQVTLITTLENLAGYDLIISMGGDGTMLRCARACAPKNIPVFGINCGTLGFLAAAEKEELTSALQALLDGKCISHKRLLLNVDIYQAEHTQTYTAFNDCVLHSANMRAFFIQADFNHTALPPYFGDGVIVSTPTGSTAYSLAAGGPIVEPSVDVLIVTPVCPHTLHQRPMVLPANGTLTLYPTFKNKEDRAIATFDGQLHVTLEPKATLTISRASQTVTLLTLPERGFFTVLHKKLSWGNL